MLLVQTKAMGPTQMYFASVATRKLLSIEDRGHALDFAAAAVIGKYFPHLRAPRCASSQLISHNGNIINYGHHTVVIASCSRYSCSTHIFSRIVEAPRLSQRLSALFCCCCCFCFGKIYINVSVVLLYRRRRAAAGNRIWVLVHCCIDL